MKYIGPTLSVATSILFLLIGTYKTYGVYKEDIMLKINNRTSIK